MGSKTGLFLLVSHWLKIEFCFSFVLLIVINVPITVKSSSANKLHANDMDKFGLFIW